MEWWKTGGLKFGVFRNADACGCALFMNPVETFEPLPREANFRPVWPAEAGSVDATEAKPSGEASSCGRTVITIFPLLAALLSNGCVTSIVPPASPPNPTPVCIVDYGRHASLVLPNDGRSVEFEYGEWKWLARGQNQSPRAVPALFWPTQGTLGQRHLAYPPDPMRLVVDKVAQDVLCMSVSSNDVVRLREKLQGRYEANLHTELFNPESGMTFVQDHADYAASHNCNHELAAWLRELNCTLRGSAFFARFKILPPHE